VIVARRALVLLAVIVCVVVTAGGAAAQDPEGTATTAVPSPPQIIPRPDSGTQPQEAGDRGGTLQLGLLTLLVVVIAGVVLVLVRQSQRARGNG